MTAKHSTTKASVEQKRGQDEKQPAPKGWFARHLWPLSRQKKDSRYGSSSGGHITDGRPRTAPSTGAGEFTHDPSNTSKGLEVPVTAPSKKRIPPPRPSRPDSGVNRDVNMWLDASVNRPSPPLMGGLQYWREGTSISPSPSAHVQYAIPIMHTFSAQAPDTQSTIRGSPKLGSFCRRAKKVQVRMPSLLRSRSQRCTVKQKKQANRRSASMPVGSLPTQAPTAPSAIPFQQARPFVHVQPTASQALTYNRLEQLEADHGRSFTGPPRISTPGSGNGSPQFADSEISFERRVNVALRQPKSMGDLARPTAARERLAREASVETISDVPTYFSGPPPPSYRSRTGSVLTTSSFGCVDGMKSERRHSSQQRTHRSQGMKGKFKRLVKLN